MTLSVSRAAGARGPIVRTLAALAAAMLVGLGLIAGPASPAHAASRVDVSTNPSADGSTTVTLSGSGFQYQPNAPGGVYIFFGTVSDPTTNAWAPSQGGRSGETFTYAGSGGAMLLAAFDGGSSADAANAVIRSDGTWSAQMTIPGSRFAGTFGDPHSGSDQTGGEVDCLKVTCGIITIGAHGLWNANNESFTPVSFVTSGGAVKQGTETPDFQEEQSYDDDATVVDVPSASEAPEAGGEASGGESAGEAAPEATQTPEVDQATAEPDPQAAADAAETDQTTTYLVFGVLGLAVLLLIVAVVVFVVRRAKDGRERRELAAVAAGGPAGEAANDDGSDEGAGER